LGLRGWVRNRPRGALPRRPALEER
jgi:hypothetical protein